METVGRRDHINEWFAGYVARVAGPDADPNSLSSADIKALPRSRSYLETPPFLPVDEPETAGGSHLKRIAPTEALERLWRADRFLEMTGVELAAEEKAA